MARTRHPEKEESDDMTTVQCACGFRELADEMVLDHLHRVFEAGDGKGNDGLVYEEGDRQACLCGYAADTTDDLDQHLLKSFAPRDGLGRDGQWDAVVTG
jgi:hypothetical protein